MLPHFSFLRVYSNLLTVMADRSLAEGAVFCAMWPQDARQVFAKPYRYSGFLMSGALGIRSEREFLSTFFAFDFFSDSIQS